MSSYHLGWTKQNFGQTSPKTRLNFISLKYEQNISLLFEKRYATFRVKQRTCYADAKEDFITQVNVVRTRVGFCRTWAKCFFGQCLMPNSYLQPWSAWSRIEPGKVQVVVRSWRGGGGGGALELKGSGIQVQCLALLPPVVKCTLLVLNFVGL